MVYLFVIHISHAFSYAHSGDLTHGRFDLTQVILDGTWSDFKIINFRPWLAQGKSYGILDEGQNSRLSAEAKLKLARSRDLFCFGEALYDMMMNKTTKDEQFVQKVVMGHSSIPTPAPNPSSAANVKSDTTSPLQPKASAADASQMTTASQKEERNA